MEKENILIQNSNPMRKLVVAWDLDGTLIDSSHRAYNEEGLFCLDHWIANCTKDNIFKDDLLPLYELYKEYKKTGFTQICVTARTMSEHDFDFLKHHDLTFDMILHRADSKELDEVLKSRKLQDYFEENQMIPFIAFDDKQANLEIFDKFGFRTFHAEYMNEKLKVGSYQELTMKPGHFVKAP